MRMRRNRPGLIALMLLLIFALTTTGFAASADPTEETGTKMIECPDCGTLGVVLSEAGEGVTCEACGGSGYIHSPSGYYNTPWALLPPVIAIALALITKEVYSSLFIGILMGGLLYSNFSFEGTVLHAFQDGIVASLSDSYNVGILIFLVILGAIVCLMNKAGGSAAFGRWAQKNIKTRAGAQLSSIVLGCLIFIDDYFNCLTVGSVMRPITDKHNVSRAKLAYLIDATAAPICIIAPISSWAAAVAAFAEDGQGLNLFIRAIPYNFYALLTIVMMVGLVVLNVDFGPMAKHEKNAVENGDLFSGSNPYAMMDDEIDESKGSVMDLVLPIAVLVVSCVVGMIYSGGFFSGEGFIAAFSNSDASVGLMLGSAWQKAVSDEATARQKAIAAETAARQSAINAEATARKNAVAALERHKFACGTYTGNGTSQTIQLSFTPKAVVIPIANTNGALTGVCLWDKPLNSIKIVTGGFTVSNVGSSLAHSYEYANTSGVRYAYLAFA